MCVCVCVCVCVFINLNLIIYSNSYLIFFLTATTNKISYY